MIILKFLKLENIKQPFGAWIPTRIHNKYIFKIGSKSKWHKIQIYVAQDPDPFGRGSRSKWHEMRLQVAQGPDPQQT